MGKERCEALAGTKTGNGTVERAEYVPAEAPVLNTLQKAMIGAVAPTLANLKAPQGFCRASARLQPVPDSEIKVEVWLPENWNGKLLASGGGGFNGGLATAPLSLAGPLSKGYAGAVNNAGHDVSNSAKFAHGHPEKLVDYGHRANHLTAQFSKSLVAAHYRAPVKRAYFHGCSNGGREALMEAQRYPEDYDGIIAGAPANNYVPLLTSFLWNQQVLRTAPKLQAKLRLVQDAVISKCDALDGVKDSVLENPAACRFDPAELECKAANGADCLAKEEVSALRKIYEGPRLRDGRQLISGMPVGGEALPGNWNEWMFTEDKGQPQLGTEFFRWMVHGDSAWELDRFDIDRDYAIAQERVAPILNSDNPDIRGFSGRGGKLILYHGWNDAAIPAGNTLAYYQAVRDRIGTAAQQVRLFMAPGMMHCFGGSGPSSFDMVSELDRWVESGIAPERVIATQYDRLRLSMLDAGSEAKVIRTRPLCPWPKTAHYNGTGSTDDAANFACR
jgi:fermentation-respiration switch protein FrsA (DUF1100 family)